MLLRATLHELVVLLHCTPLSVTDSRIVGISTVSLLSGILSNLYPYLASLNGRVANSEMYRKPLKLRELAPIVAHVRCLHYFDNSTTMRIGSASQVLHRLVGQV